MGPVVDAALPNLATVRLTTDLAPLTAHERTMLPILIEAADLMEDVYWREVVGPREEALASVQDPRLRRKFEINAGPWDRLSGDEPFIPNVGERPKGARFYPPDMTVEEFDRAADKEAGEAFRGTYTIVRRDVGGRLEAVPYHVAFATQSRRAADLLRQAARLADDAGLRRYLEVRATALETDDYRPSDEAWMDMKSNRVDIVIGPIEVYDDKLLGCKASHQAIVLIRDLAWSQRLIRYRAMLPRLQAALPVPSTYQSEEPGLDADLNVYDAVYHSGFANRPPVASAINLPNDEEVALTKGTRRLQLKNVMRAKFEAIVVPIARAILPEDQLAALTFDAWFEGIMFHEIAHGLGLHHTIDRKRTVRHALRDQATAVEEQKADVLGQFMLQWLAENDEPDHAPRLGHVVAHVTDFFRLLRFGGASPYARISASELTYLIARGGVERDNAGRYRVDVELASAAFAQMATRLLTIQGDGDHAGAIRWYEETGRSGTGFRAEIERLAKSTIPIDVVFEQGPDVLGLGNAH
jgi:hypothetical protein